MSTISNFAYMAKNYVESLFNREEGQDVFEYILIVAGISVVILATAALTVPDLFDLVIGGLCDAINGITGVTITCP